MRKIIARILLSVFLFVPLHSMAAQFTASGTIVGLYFDATPGTERLLFRHTNQINPDNCSKGGAYYELKYDASTSQAALSLLLSVDATQRTVRIYLDGCGPTGWPLAVLIDTVI